MRFSQTLIALCMTSAIVAQAADDPKVDAGTLARGRYVLAISGCNDCHTVGYPEAAGKISESEWLTGNPVGFNGPWGTTYPANLRLTVQTMSEQAWMTRARSPMRPPMPWFSLRDMSDADVRAAYWYIRSLGAKGKAAPAYVAPGQRITTPYIEFVPKNLPHKAAAK